MHKETMNYRSCHLAFYDAENQVPGSVSYWHCHPSEIGPASLDRFYLGFARQCRPASMSDVRSGCIYGGIARISAEWTVIFRYGDGGRNSAGRPGRNVIVAIFVRASEVRGIDLAGLLRCQQVESLIADAFVKCPTPVPGELEFDFEAISTRADPVLLGQVIREGELLIQGMDSLKRASGIFAHLPEKGLWLLKIGRDDSNEEVAEIRRIIPELQPPPTPPHFQPSVSTGGNPRRGCLSRVARGILTLPKQHGLLILIGLMVALVVLFIQIQSPFMPRGMDAYNPAKVLPPSPPAIDPDSARGEVEKPSFTPPDYGDASTNKGVMDRFLSSWAKFQFALKWFVFGLVTGGGIVAFMMRRRKSVASLEGK